MIQGDEQKRGKKKKKKRRWEDEMRKGRYLTVVGSDWSEETTVKTRKIEETVMCLEFFVPTRTIVNIWFDFSNFRSRVVIKV